ncbi:MAG: Flp pilus assembly protein CpaB [Acidimicrobiales bacterium]
MGSRRVVVLLVAVVVAAVAGVATYRYLNDVRNSAGKKANLVPVFIVDRPIARGTPAATAVSKGLVKLTQVDEKLRPPNAFEGDLASLRGLVAVIDLPPGQVLVPGLFVKPAVAQGTLSRQLADGNVAVTVSADGVRGVASNVVPGDFVDLLVLVSPVKPDGTPGGPKNLRFLYQNVKVLAIGTSGAVPTPASTTPPAGGSANAAAGSGLITFEVPAFAAEKIAYAALGLGAGSAGGADGGGGNGGSGAGLYLVLVPPGNQATPVPPVDANNILTGPLTPCQDTPTPASDCSTKAPS